MNLINHAVKRLEELLKQVVKLTITLTKTETMIIKRRKHTYRDKIIHSYEYSFDEVSLLNNKLLAKGRPIVLYDIAEGYTVETISLFVLDDDKQYECIYSNLLYDYFPTGGTLTFEGTMNIEVN